MTAPPGTHTGSPPNTHLLCVHQCALDCCADLTTSLAANTHAALAVTHNSHAAEAHQLASLDHLQCRFTAGMRETPTGSLGQVFPKGLEF